jgi:hypothetical protein
MADTSRTVTDLTTNLFQDGQSAGAITPQDLRDFIETCQTKQGSIYVSTPASTSIAVAGTYVEGAGTYTLSVSPAANEFDMNTNARLRYTGTPTVNCMFMASVSLEIDTAITNKEFAVALHKNGTLITGTKIVGFSPATTVNSVNLYTIGYASMATNDYISAFVANMDSTDNLTIRNAQLMGMSLVT